MTGRKDETASADPGVAENAEVRVSAGNVHSDATRSDAGSDATIATIMTTPVRAVKADTTVSDLAALFVGSNISAAPVIDGRGHAVGLVSKTDIVRYFYESDGNAERLDPNTALGARLDIREGYHVDVHGNSVVGEVMTPIVLALPMEAAIGRAAALMAYEQVHHLVVTDAELLAAGMLSSLDVMAWLARRNGYAVPEPRPRQPNMAG